MGPGLRAAAPGARRARHGRRVEAPATKAEVDSRCPNREGSLKFGVLGDFGTGEPAQYQLAEQMAKLHDAISVRAGDHWSATTSTAASGPTTSGRKFEIPYKPLLDSGVKFYASLGNHDARNQRFYKLFNMDGKLYYSFKAPKQNVRFFALETTYAEPEQMAWVAKELKGANDDWKIPFFHHPLYSSGERHGSDIRLRTILEPLFVEHDVSVVFTGPRPLLRADQAAEGHLLLRGGLRRQAARRQHRLAAPASPPRASTPTWRFWRPRSSRTS